MRFSQFNTMGKDDMNNGTFDIETLLDARQVSKILRCSAPLVYKMAERGQLACIRWEAPGEGTKKPRTTVRFQLEDIRSFIERNYQRGMKRPSDYISEKAGK